MQSFIVHSCSIAGSLVIILGILRAGAVLHARVEVAGAAALEVRHQVGLEGGDVEGAAGAVHHRAEQPADLGAGAGLHQLVHGLGRAAQLTGPATNNSGSIRVLF